MSQETLEVVARAEAALSERDIHAYLACFAEDIRVQAPWGPVEEATKARTAFGGSGRTSRPHCPTCA
jgi:hypothetical protein